MRPPSDTGRVRVVAELPNGSMSFEADDARGVLVGIERLAHLVPAVATWRAEPAGKW